MYYKKSFHYISMIALSAMFFAACGGGASSTTAAESNSHAEAPAEEAPAEATPTAASNDGAVEINIAGNDLMQYDTKEIKVPAGSKVRLTLTHSGQLAKAAMGHNFVLLSQGTVLEDFATSAMQATDSDYIPAGSEEAVIAHTKLLGGGESDTIEFDAPAAGTYDFLCTFPGHFALMQGKFIVE